MDTEDWQKEKNCDEKGMIKDLTSLHIKVNTSEQ